MGINVFPTDWDTKKQRLKPKAEDVETTNLILDVALVSYLISVLIIGYPKESSQDMLFKSLPQIGLIGLMKY